MLNQVDFSNIEVSQEGLDVPAVEPKAVEFIKDLCRNKIVSWIHENAPDDIRGLICVSDFLDCYYEDALENGGLVATGINEEIGENIPIALNLLARLDVL